MGSLLMECPLCCNEKFTSRHGLKSHLLEMVEKLACPTCNEQFNDIQDLIEHLDQECQDIASSSSEQASFPASTDVTVVKEEEVDIENLLNKSILAKALLLKNKSGRTEGSMKVVETVVESGAAQLQLQITDPPQQKSGEEDVYYCSTCTINFTSIEKHLEKFHQGDEVFIEDTEDVQNSSELLPRPEEVTEDGTVTVYPEQEDSVPSQIDSDSQEDDADEEGVVIKDFPQILNTVQQQEIFDKDGRLYTRKVVKIEKFWDDEGDKPIPPPIKERYEIVNGKAQKISEKSEPTGSERLLEVYKCKQCDRQFTKLDQYYKHKCGSKTKNFEFKCSKCQITFATARMLCLHMRKHKNESAEEGFAKHGSPFVCETCNTDFPSYKSLRLHKRMHDPVKTRAIEAPVSYGITGGAESKEEREVFMCQICNKAYDKQYEEAHMNFHENGNNFDCNVCNRKFHTKSNLEMHMRAHSNGKKFTCSYCKKGFISYETMQEHILNQCQKRRYECQYCGRRFARPHEKVKHERIHTGEKPHVCQICGKAFRVSYCLTLHMRTHSGTRPYQCPHCNKRFKAHSVYNHHLLTHSDVRAYKCPYCPKAFKTGVQLAGHKNSHIKPFTCNQCNRPFASLYAVRAHMETHKRENNLKYVCWLCGASYARAFALRDHIKEQHPNASEESANCIIPEVEEGQAMLILDGAVIEQMETQ